MQMKLLFYLREVFGLLLSKCVNNNILKECYIVELKLIFLKQFIKEFDKEPFEVTFCNGESMLVGESSPKFKLKIKRPLERKDIMNSTSLAFGEAYMNGDVEFEGDLFFILNTFMSQIDKFSKMCIRDREMGELYI